jgi:hypothetical protein
VKDVIVKARVSRETAADLAELSSRAGTTVSDLVRNALEQQLPALRAGLGIPPHSGNAQEAV